MREYSISRDSIDRLLTTVQADPDAAARFLRRAKEKQNAELRSGVVYEAKEQTEERPHWFHTSREEVQEKLGRESLWSAGPSPRGKDYEKLRGAHPASTLRHVDDLKFEEGSVTGMKSIELRDTTYQDIGGLDRRVKECIDELEGYPGGQWENRYFYRGIHFDDVYLEIGIPEGQATPSQVEKLLEMQEYAQTKGVTLVINEVP